MVDYEKYEDRIPSLTLGALRNYIEYGVPTGGFLRSVLSDSLFGAWSRADGENRKAIGDIVMFIYNEAPGSCHGSKQHVDDWLEKGGRQGRHAFYEEHENRKSVQTEIVEINDEK